MYKKAVVKFFDNCFFVFALCNNAEAICCSVKDGSRHRRWVPKARSEANRRTA